MNNNLKLTNEELLELENVLDMLRVYTLPDFPADDNQKIASLRRLVTPKMLLILSKVHLQIGRVNEAQAIFGMMRELESKQFNATH